MAHRDPTIDPPLTEADIQAFADGSLSPDRAAQVQRYLGAMPGEATRIAFYRRLNGQMQRSFTQPTAPAADDSEFIPPRGARAGVRRVSRALFGSVAQRIALLVLALCGWAATAFVSEHQLNAAAVMSYAQWAGGGAPVAATPALASRDPFSTEFAQLGWKLMSVKTLRLGLIADAQEFDYRNAEGAPIVLLTTSAPLVIERPRWLGHRVGELRLLTWTDHGTRYVLAGRADARGLMKAADAATFH
jgi:anti-sigma factor RsiW